MKKGTPRFSERPVCPDSNAKPVTEIEGKFIKLLLIHVSGLREELLEDRAMLDQPLITLLPFFHFVSVFFKDLPMLFLQLGEFVFI